MGRIRRIAVEAVIALLLVALSIPAGVLDPDPAAVQAAALRPRQPEAAAPATPGTYRSASSATSVPVTAIAINKPAGVTTNDVLLAGISVRGNPTITPPSGWTLVRSDNSSTTLLQSVYRKVATGSEPSS